jgi:hypothetical protein
MRMAGMNQKTANDLKQLGLTYHQFHDAQGKGPANSDEFAQWASTNMPERVALIQQTGPGGKYVLFYGQRIPADFPSGTSNTVLGHEAQVPASGGIVLMADTSTRQMSAAEFAAAVKPTAPKK